MQPQCEKHGFDIKLSHSPWIVRENEGEGTGRRSGAHGPRIVFESYCLDDVTSISRANEETVDAYVYDEAHIDICCLRSTCSSCYDANGNNGSANESNTN